MPAFFSIVTVALASSIAFPLFVGAYPGSHLTAKNTSSRPVPIPSTFEQPDFSYNTLLDLTTQFWDSFVYPANVVQAKSINSTFFAEDVIGRVDVTRVFPGRELNTEYLYGYFAALALNPSIVSLVGVPINHTTIHFAATKNVVASSELVYFNISLVEAVLPVELDLWFTYNANGEISQYDATIRWFAEIYDLLFAAVGQAQNFTSTSETVGFLTKALATQICGVATDYCSGPNQQYDSTSQCIDFLTTEVRFGASYEAGGNTLLCRSVHEVMVPLRPDVHCPHIGPTGGGMCVDDLTYAEKVVQLVFTNSPFVPVLE